MTRLEDLRLKHLECEDDYYSCPLSEGGCANPEYKIDECNCGASDHNEKLDELINMDKP